MITKESAKTLCDFLNLSKEFFDENNEDYITLKRCNENIATAYRELFELAEGVETRHCRMVIE